METMDGELSQPFPVVLREIGVDLGGGILGWRGDVATDAHKYAGMTVEMTPRHIGWTGVVVLKVKEGEDTIFSGMADTTGLEKQW